MWSAAYGLIALAVVAFVVHYAVLHTPDLASVNLADQLYHVKKRLADNITSLPRTDSQAYFVVGSNLVKVKVVDATASGGAFPVQLPIGYKLRGGDNNLLYELYLNVISCRSASLQGGAAATLYVVELKHSLSQLPWLEVYAAVPRDVTQYYSWLHSYYTAWRRPPAVGLTPRVGADEAFMELVKAEHILVYNATSDTAKLHVAAPAAALYVLLVDYPLKLPLTCPEQIASASSESQRSDTPVIGPPSPR